MKDDKLKKAQEMYDVIFKGAAGVIATGAEHAPILFMSQGPIIVGLEIPDGAPKEWIAEMHRQADETGAVDAAILVMEAWSLEAKSDEAKDIMRRMDSIANAPGREEILAFNFRVRGAQFIAACRIDRKTNTLEQGPLVDMRDSGTQWRGRMVGQGSRKVH